MNTKQEQLLQLFNALEKHSQHATSTAVAGVLGLSPLSVMQELPKKSRNSWIVSKQVHQPTGYSKSSWQQPLKSNSTVISSTTALATWWEQHR